MLPILWKWLSQKLKSEYLILVLILILAAILRGYRIAEPGWDSAHYGSSLRSIPLDGWHGFTLCEWGGVARNYLKYGYLENKLGMVKGHGWTESPQYRKLRLNCHDGGFNLRNMVHDARVRLHRRLGLRVSWHVVSAPRFLGRTTTALCRCRHVRRRTKIFTYSCREQRWSRNRDRAIGTACSAVRTYTVRKRSAIGAARRNPRYLQMHHEETTSINFAFKRIKILLMITVW